MKKNKKNCYEFGSFVKANSAGIGSAGQMATGVLEGFKNPNKANIGLGAAQGALSGAAAGAALGPLGMAGGAIIGGVSGLVSGIQQKKAIDSARDSNYGNLQGQALDSMTTANVNPYGTQIYQDGSYVTTSVDPRKPIKPRPYQPNIMLPGWDGMVQKADGSVGMWGLPLDSTRIKAPIVPTIPIGYTDHRGQLSGQRYQGTPATTKAIELKEKALRAQSSRNYYADGSDVEQNIINIEKGELQIDPNTGKILREFNGVNPETAGLYKDHNKKGKDTSNNFVTADPGTFIITKAKAKKYKDAVENNDKLTQQTILQNIRNYKSEVKGDKLKFAGGSDVPVNINPFMPNKYLGTAASGYGQVPVAPMQGFGNPIFNPNVPNAPFNWGNPNEVPTSIQEGISPVSTINQKPFGVGNVQANTLAKTTSYTPSGVGQQGFGANVLGAISQYGPAAMNIARGLFGKVEQEGKITANRNPYLNQIQAGMPQDINMQPIYNDIYSQGRTATNDIRNNSNSSAVFRANRQNLGANTQRQIAGARLQGDMANNQIRGQRGSIYNQLGSQYMNEQARVQGYNAQIDQINAQNRGAKSDLLGKGISQIQEVYQNNKYNDKMQSAEMYKANLLPQIFELSKHYPTLLEDLKKLAGK